MNTNTQTSQLSEAIVQTITCPITQEVMREPMQAPDGHNYEKDAIIEWLQRNPISPQTREHMKISDLKVNANIRFLCDEYHKGCLGSLPKISQNYDFSINTIKLNHKITTNNSNDKYMISFNIDNTLFDCSETDHLSQDIILAIDRSGSMGALVQAKDGKGNKLENGFSIQDIVNHAAKTVVETLDIKSRCAIIAFDNNIEVVFQLNTMNKINKSKCLCLFENIKPRGQTNIWGAIDKAISILNDREDKSRNGQIILFTDGEPNISPARGEVETLKKLREKNNFTFPIYTFGFGYNLQRELLYNMAKYANGGNGHIPDGNMIATVFCNFISTILCTVVVNLQLHVMTPGVYIYGDYASYKNNENKNIIYDLGTVQYQQSRDIIFRSTEKEEKEVKYYFTYTIGNNQYTSDNYIIKMDNIESLNVDDNAVNDHFMRYQLVEMITSVINYNKCRDFEKSKLLINEMDIKLRSAIYTKSSLIIGMLENLSGSDSEGEIKLASEKKYFMIWGELYLDQLRRSLNQQIKPNFKDKACVFGGSVFDKIVDKASDIFDSLPPPTPSKVNFDSQYSSYQNLNSNYTSLSMTSLSIYNDVNGGCYKGDSLIMMANSTQKQVKNIKKGDKVLSMDGINYETNDYVTASVICVVKTIYKSPIKLVHINNYTENGIYITPWHPINLSNKWIFPNMVNKEQISNVTEVYNLILDNYHIVIVENIPCICLGHNFYQDKILKHPYFGTKNVIRDFQKLKNWDTGLVEIDGDKFIRDIETNLVIGYNI